MNAQVKTHASATRRPARLAEVVDWGRTRGDIDAYLREFLDAFYGEDDPARRAGMLADEPALTGEPQVDAYLGAVAEHLAGLNRSLPPSWTENQARFLKLAYFPCGLESLKAQLIKESPIAFRRRLIFVDMHPLYRPRLEKSTLTAPKPPRPST